MVLNLPAAEFDRICEKYEQYVACNTLGVSVATYTDNTATAQPWMDNPGSFTVDPNYSTGTFRIPMVPTPPANPMPFDFLPPTSSQVNLLEQRIRDLESLVTALMSQVQAIAKRYEPITINPNGKPRRCLIIEREEDANAAEA